MTFEEIVKQLESRTIMPSRPPSLEPTKIALSRLELHYPIDLEKVIVVAGTNGKGSVCKTLETLFLAANKSVGLFTSPHLVSICERIRADGKNITQQDFITCYEKLEPILSDLKLSHFEMLTIMAAWYFFSGQLRPPCEWTILEVGLGGTWDSTNAIPHQTSVITRLGLDHQDLLGDTLLEIAKNKFGIVTHKSHVYYTPFENDLIPIAKQFKLQTLSQWTPAIEWSYGTDNSTPPNYYIQTPWGEFKYSLPGERGAENTALALTVFNSLGFNPAEYLTALEKLSWPGRMNQLYQQLFPCPVYLSGDHNPQGIQSLIQLLPDFKCRKIHFLVGIGIKKNAELMLEKLSQINNSTLWLTTTPFRGRQESDYGSWIKKCEKFEPDPLEALLKILPRVTKDDLVIVTGSLYLVGYLMEKFNN